MAQKSIIYRGKEYPSMRALAKKFNLDYDRLRSRIHTRGWCIEDAIESELQIGVHVHYKGKTYPSIMALAKELNLDYRLLQSRLHRGWHIDQAVNAEKMLLNAITWNKQRYPSIKSLSDHLQIPYKTLLSAYAKTGDMNVAVKFIAADSKHRETTITLWGVEYPNLKNLAASFGLNYQALYVAFQRNEKLEDTITRLLNSDPIGFEGRKYANLSELCMAYKIQTANVHLRLRLGMSLENAIKTPIRAKSGKSVCYRGEIYPSYIAMCRAYGISTQCVYTQMRYLDTDYLEMFDVLVALKERIGLSKDYQLNYVPACIYHGQPIKSIPALAKILKLEVAKIYVCKINNKYSDVFAALREMQAAVKPVYTIDNVVYTYSQLSKRLSGFEIQRLVKARSMVPIYPQLQGIDFIIDCIDVLALRREILKAKNIQYKEFEQNQFGQQIEMKM